MTKHLIVLSFLISSTKLLAVTYPGSFIIKGYGANGYALGGTYTATVSDSSALYWNPAGLATIRGESMQLKKITDEKADDPISSDPDFDELLGEIDNLESSEQSNDPVVVQVRKETFELHFYNSAAILARQRVSGASTVAFTLPAGTLAFGAQAIASPELTEYDSLGVAGDKKRYLAYAAHAGYALELGSLRIGGTLTGFEEDISGTKWHGGLLNLGVQASPIPILAIGLTLHNLAGIVQRSAGVDTYRKPDTILNVAFALSTPPPSDNLRILVGFQGNLDQPDNDPLRSKIGAAYALNRYSFLMLGLDGGRPSAGFGVDFSWIRASYAMNRDKLGTEYEHHVELSFIF